jgi:hypothetical protein
MCIWGGLAVPLWSYALGFAFALTGAVVYFLDSSGYIAIFSWALGPVHDYTKLLIINIAILAGGFGAFILGASLPHRADSQAPG